MIFLRATAGDNDLWGWYARLGGISALVLSAHGARAECGLQRAGHPKITGRPACNQNMGQYPLPVLVHIALDGGSDFCECTSWAPATRVEEIFRLNAGEPELDGRRRTSVVGYHVYRSTNSAGAVCTVDNRRFLRRTSFNDTSVPAGDLHLHGAGGEAGGLPASGSYYNPSQGRFLWAVNLTNECGAGGLRFPAPAGIGELVGRGDGNANDIQGTNNGTRCSTARAFTNGRSGGWAFSFNGVTNQISVGRHPTPSVTNNNFHPDVVGQTHGGAHRHAAGQQRRQPGLTGQRYAHLPQARHECVWHQSHWRGHFDRHQWRECVRACGQTRCIRRLVYSGNDHGFGRISQWCIKPGSRSYM